MRWLVLAALNSLFACYLLATPVLIPAPWGLIQNSSEGFKAASRLKLSTNGCFNKMKYQTQ